MTDTERQLYCERIERLAQSFLRITDGDGGDWSEEFIDYFTDAQHRPGASMIVSLTTLEAISERIAELSQMALAGSLVQEEGAWSAAVAKTEDEARASVTRAATAGVRMGAQTGRMDVSQPNLSTTSERVRGVPENRKPTGERL